jgi:hypothetical protein
MKRRYERKDREIENRKERVSKNNERNEGAKNEINTRRKKRRKHQIGKWREEGRREEKRNR